MSGHLDPVRRGRRVPGGPHFGAALAVCVAFCAAGCSPTYWALPSEDRVPEFASLKAAAAEQPRRVMRVGVRRDDGRTVRLALHETGSGRRDRVVVLLHGVFSDSRAWKFVRGDLGADHDLLAIDLPGAGRSDHPAPSALGPRGYAPEAMAGDVLAALRWYVARRHRAPDITLVGHSLGSTVVLRMLTDPVLLRQFPDVAGAVDTVVLLAPVDPAASPDVDHSFFDRLATVSGRQVCMADLSGALREQAAVGARRNVVDPRRATREDADWVVEILKDGPRRRAMQAMLRQAAPPAPAPPGRLREVYARLRAPVLVVVGEREPWVPPRLARELADVLPDGEVRVVERARHSLPTECPTLLSGIIREFIAARAGNRPPRPTPGTSPSRG